MNGLDCKICKNWSGPADAAGFIVRSQRVNSQRFGEPIGLTLAARRAFLARQLQKSLEVIRIDCQSPRSDSSSQRPPHEATSWIRPPHPDSPQSIRFLRMEAKLRHKAVGLTVCCLLVLCCLERSADGATHRTANFVVTAPTAEMAEKVARCAEVWREDLALMWLGETLPNWYKPCPISVKCGQIGAGGSTTFTFDDGEVFGWNMKVQGTLERILDSVIPHEVNHTIFASHFRRPVPRWADEGAATLFEHRSEQARQLATLNRVVRTSRRIPLQQLLTMTEYPDDMQDVFTLYAEGFSLARYLVERKGAMGRRTYLAFLEDAHRTSWSQAIHKHYGYESVDALEEQWTDWILAGSPEQSLPDGTMLAQNESTADDTTGRTTAVAKEAQGAVIRGQSPDAYAPLQPVPRKLRSRVARTADAAPSPPNAATAPLPDSTHRRTVSPSASTFSEHLPARGDAGDSRQRSGSDSSTSVPLSRDALNPTADGISSHANARSYQFPKMRAF